MPDVFLNQESPMKQAFDQFDLEHADWGVSDYVKYAVQTNPEDNNKLLVSDWKWRKVHGQNVVASIEGSQGAGKSMPFSYCGLLLGTIYDFPFTPNHVFFSPEDLDTALSKANPRETFFKDEHLKAKAGIMSNLISESLEDYEDQLRIHQNNLLFAAVQLQSHSHFFCFEAKHIVFDATGYPERFVSILKTPRYTDKNEFVWRGYVSFPMPNKNFVEEYLKKKEEHIVNLKAKYGNTLDIVGYFAKQLFEKKEESLVRRTKEGFCLPIKKELMDFVVAEEIGTRRFTTAGYNLLNAKIRELIEHKYQLHNEKTASVLAVSKEAKVLEKKEELDRKEQEAEKKRELKMQFFQQKLAEEKRKNDLKEKSLLLKEKALLQQVQTQENLEKKIDEQNKEKEQKLSEKNPFRKD